MITVLGPIIVQKLRFSVPFTFHLFKNQKNLHIFVFILTKIGLKIGDPYVFEN